MPRLTPPGPSPYNQRNARCGRLKPRLLHYALLGSRATGMSDEDFDSDDSPLVDRTAVGQAPPALPPPRRSPPMPPSPPPPLRLGRLLGILAVLLAALASPGVVERIQYAKTRGQMRAKADVAREQLSKAGPDSERFRWVVQSVEPSVVHINSLRVVRGRVGRTGADLLDWQPKMVNTGQGSGVIVDAAGYVLTNNHVIDGAAQIDVYLSDGRKIEAAVVVGFDPLTDLAVLKIDADGLIACPWGDSNALEVGDWVLALGTPFGLDRTVTAGIVSARRAPGDVNRNPYMNFVQTDAAVNPGNSGGPLVNLQGEVVGINTMIVGETYRGISFAIPSETAQEVYDRLKSTGRYARGWLGVNPRDVTADEAQQFGLEEARGALVTEVLPNSPAQAAGIQAGDVIVDWDGAAIDYAIDLQLRVGKTAIGSKVKIELVRNGQRMKLETTVGDRSAATPR